MKLLASVFICTIMLVPITFVLVAYGVVNGVIEGLRMAGEDIQFLFDEMTS